MTADADAAVNAPLISCIVPVFNGERFLGEALDSILAQTHRPREIIVVDDGSTDRTPEVAALYRGRITYVRQANRGSAAAKNRGLGLARGQLVAFLDADDRWHPEKLARQRRRLLAHPDLSLCFTRFQNFWMPELADEAKRYQDGPLSAPSSAWSISTLLAPRALFDRLGPFQDGLRGNENMLWFFRAAGAGATIEVMPDVLMYRRYHRDNDTRRGPAHLGDLLVPIVKAWRDYRRGRP
jgi:glycosyltransferase involved in cell wall biosynthesis